MKKAASNLLLLAMLVALFACGRQKASQPEHPFSFYYWYQGDQSPRTIQPEVREYDPAMTTVSELMALYLLTGPITQGFRSPFPAGLSILQVEEIGSTLKIAVSTEWESLSGVELTAAAACLVYTATQLDGIDTVLLQTPNGMLSNLINVPLTAEQFLSILPVAG